MAASFVKTLGSAFNKTAGTTLAHTFTGATTAGNLIVARVLFDNFTTASKPIVSSIGRMAGETNNWVSLGRALSTSTSAGAFASGELMCILTTVNWSAAAYTTTLDSSVTMKAVQFDEFAGTTATLRSTAGTNYSTTTTAASATTTGTTPVVDDLAVGFIFGSNVAAAMAGDNDTSAGSWSAVTGFGSTGSSAATNNFGVGQYKVLTAATHQTLNNSAAMTAGNGAIVAILQALPVPSITQAAYRFYDEAGTESGSTALAAQDTAITADLNAGVGYGQLRVRLQSTTAVAVPATDDFTLQWEKNASGSWTNIPGGAVLGYDAAGLTEAQATTNRLTGGTGSFVAGKVAEDGVVDNLGWTANNYTELVFSLRISGATLANADVLRFRVVRNGATTGMTYTATPTINVSSSTTWLPPVLTSLAAWLDPADPAPFSLSGTEILTFNDKGPNAYVATGAALTSAQRPNRTGTMNGKTTVTFDGGDWLRTNIPATLKPFTFATVVNMTAGSTDRSFLGCSAAAGVGDGGWQMRASFTTDEFCLNTSNTAEVIRSTAVPEGTPTLIVLTYSATGAWTLRYNGLQVGSGTNNLTPTASRFHLIGNNSYTSLVESFTGQMGDIVLCNAVLAGTDLNNLENYLYTKWIGTPPVTQEGFRWRNDDGTQTTATWKVAQDTNASLDVGTSARLRMLLDSTGVDPAPTAYTLYYKKSTDSTWLPVPVGAGGGSPVYVASSSNITASGEATTALLTPPSGKTTGDFTIGRMWDDENGTDLVDIGASSFVPTSLPNCVLWLDGDGSSFTPSQWSDKSGGNNHVVQATSGKQPARSVAALNGRDVVVFDRATADCMIRPAGTNFLSGTTATLFIVAYLDSTPTNDDRVFGVCNGQGFNEDYQAGGAAFVYASNSGFYPASYRDPAGSTSQASSMMSAQWLKITSIYDGTNHTMYTGSTAYSSVASTATFNANQINVGCVRDGTQTANMRIAEAILYSDAKDATDRTTVWNGLNSKWGV